MSKLEFVFFEMDQTAGMESSSCDISVLPSGTMEDIEEGTD